MVCKHMVKEDQWNEDSNFFQLIDTCNISKKRCQGGDEICSKYDPVDEPENEEEKPKGEEKENPEQEPEEKEEEEEKPEE